MVVKEGLFALFDKPLEIPKQAAIASAYEAPAHRIEYKRLRLGDLRLDKYQRGVRERVQAKIAKAPNVDLLGALLVSYRDGAYWLLDGQQRVGGLKRAGWKEPVDCMVYFGLSYAEEADIFRRFNEDRSVVTAGEILRAKLEAGDEDAWAMYDVVTGLGQEVSMDANSRGNSLTTIKAVAGLNRAWKVTGRNPAFFRETLATVIAAWPEDEQRWNGNLLLGLTMFLTRYRDHEDFRLNELPAKLATVSTARLMTQAREVAAFGTSDLGNRLGMCIVERYNHKRKARRLPGWYETPAKRLGK